jgi:serine/threonine-protein kinase
VASSLIGRRFGSYVVEQKLGEGGMGAVYRAVQPEIGKLVAIKFLAEQFSSSPGVVQRFFAEARAVNLIQHDNIVDIFDFGQVDGHSYFVMELLRGASLEDVLRNQGALAVPRVLDVGVQVADAIAAAHARGIIHRDLKPDNIFLVPKSGRPDFVKLLDFGIAKLTDPVTGQGGGGQRTALGAVLGTPGYMSPEQGTGDLVDARTDVYALGVILFRMLSGRLPFDGRTFSEILQKQLTEPPADVSVVRPEVSPSLAALVHQMFARDIGARPATMAEVLARLRAELDAVGPVRPATGKQAIIGSASGAQPIIRAPSGPVPVQRSTTLSGATGQRSVADSSSAIDLPKRGPARFVAIGAAALAVAGVAVFFATRKPTPTAPPPVKLATQAAIEKPIEKPAPTAARPRRTGDAVGQGGVLVETDPPGAQVFLGSRVLGVTPVRVTLPGDEAVLRLKLPGYRDERVEVSHSIDHVFERLRRAPVETVTEPPVRPPSGPSPRPPGKKPRIGLDD